MARGRVGTRLSVSRTEDGPLREVPADFRRREAGGDMALVAIGDRIAVAAWVLPDRLALERTSPRRWDRDDARRLGPRIGQRMKEFRA
jgi:hypothetical protein